MPKNTEERTEKDISALDRLSLSGMRRKHVSPLNAPVWRLILLVSAGCVAVWIIHVLLGFSHPAPIWYSVLCQTRTMFSRL